MRTTSLIALVALTTAACGSKPAPPPPPPVAVATPVPTPAPPSVGSVTLGNAIGADKAVTMASETFATKDVIYASIATAGVGPVKLRALWSFVKGDKTSKVNETTIEFESMGPAINEFHVENSKGWPKGDYRVDIFLGDAEAPAMSKNFKVE